MNTVNRRHILTGAAGFACLHPHFAVAQSADSVTVLTAGKVKTQILGPESPPTEHWSLGQLVLRAKQNQPFRLRLVNTLEEPIWLHFFGVRGPADVMTVQAKANDTTGVDVTFTPPDAGTFWFGPLLSAAKQRELGLTGMLIVEEGGEAPAWADVPLIVDDWSIDDAGKIDPDFTNLDSAAGEGRLGNWFTVNGSYKPTITLDPGKPVRLRLLNVANTRTMRLLFKGVEGRLLARDGQPLWPQDLGTEALVLAPGQRADVLLTYAQGLVPLALDLFEDVVEILTFDAQNYGRKTLPLDTRLAPNPIPEPGAEAPRDVRLDIEGGLKGGLLKANVGKDVLDLRAMLEQGLAWSLGGTAGLGGPLLFEARKGEQLRLVFDNKTLFEQVLHIHGHVWTNGVDLARVGPLKLLVWTDTLVIPAKTTRSMTLIADNPGTWAIQSLLAERSDAGLIGSFTVSDMP